MADEATTTTTEQTSTVLGGDPPSQQQATQVTQASQQQAVTPPVFITDGSFSKGFSANLPDDLKPYQGSLQKFEGVPVADVLKSYGALEQKLGQRIAPPAPDAKPEEVAAWRKITGAPEKPEGYEIKRPDDIPEAAWNPELAKGFAELAHKHHMSPAAAKDIVDWWNGQQKGMIQQVQQDITEKRGALVDGLKKEWGDKFDSNLHAVRRVAGIAKIDVNNPEIGDNPAVIRALHSLANLIADDKQVAGGGGPSLSHAQQADDIQTNPANPLHADYYGKHGEERQRAAADRVRKLRAFAS